MQFYFIQWQYRNILALIICVIVYVNNTIHFVLYSIITYLFNFHSYTYKHTCMYMILYEWNKCVRMKQYTFFYLFFKLCNYRTIPQNEDMCKYVTLHMLNKICAHSLSSTNSIHSSHKWHCILLYALKKKIPIVSQVGTGSITKKCAIMRINKTYTDSWIS